MRNRIPFLFLPLVSILFFLCGFCLSSAQGSRYAVQIGSIAPAEFEGRASARGFRPILESLVLNEKFHSDGPSLEASSVLDSDLVDALQSHLQGLRYEKLEQIEPSKWSERQKHLVRKLTDLRLSLDWSKHERFELCRWLTKTDQGEARRYSLGQNKCESESEPRMSDEALSAIGLSYPGEVILVNGQPLAQAAQWFKLSAGIAHSSGQSEPAQSKHMEYQTGRRGSYRISLFSNQFRPLSDVIDISALSPESTLTELVRAIERLRRRAEPWLKGSCGSEQVYVHFKQQMQDRKSIFHHLWKMSVVQSQRFSILVLGPDQCALEMDGSGARVQPLQHYPEQPSLLQEDLQRRSFNQNRLAQMRSTSTVNAPSGSGMEQSAGLRLGLTTGVIDPASADNESEHSRPVYKRPWFWAVVGSLLLTSGLAIARANQGGSRGSDRPSEPRSASAPITRVGWDSTPSQSAAVQRQGP